MAKSEIARSAKKTANEQNFKFQLRINADWTIRQTDSFNFVLAYRCKIIPNQFYGTIPAALRALVEKHHCRLPLLDQVLAEYKALRHDIDSLNLKSVSTRK